MKPEAQLFYETLMDVQGIYMPMHMQIPLTFFFYDPRVKPGGRYLAKPPPTVPEVTIEMIRKEFKLLMDALNSHYYGVVFTSPHEFSTHPCECCPCPDEVSEANFMMGILWNHRDTTLYTWGHRLTPTTTVLGASLKVCLKHFNIDEVNPDLIEELVFFPSQGTRG